MTALAKSQPTVAQPIVPPAKSKAERNLGVELFRIVSMMMVVWLHVLGQGGVLSAAPHLSTNYKIALILQIITYCSVNCYGVISGFANVKTEFKFRRFVCLWIETVTLMLIMTLIIRFAIPSVSLAKDNWLMVFFPLTKRPMWYFCAYFLLFALLPILNKGLLSLKRWQHIVIIFLLMMPTVFRLIDGSDHYVLGSGYSAIWLICLYVIGAYFRIYGAPKWAKPFVTLPLFALAVLAAYLLKILPEIRFAEGLLDKTSKWYTSRSALISYISPCMVIMAVMLLLFFMQIKPRFKASKLIIKHLGKATWGVFVLHVGTGFWRYSAFWNGFRVFASYSPIKLLVSVLGAGFLTYLALSLMTILILTLLRLSHIYRLIDLLSSLPNRLKKKSAID